MRVLVTGGAGYIGSHTCKALAQAGYQPVVYDSMIHGHEWAVQWGPLERGDILDCDRLEAVLRAWRPHAVMHFAAFINVGESVINPAKYYQNNVMGAFSLLDAIRSSGVKKIVFSSTAAVYGTPQAARLNEDHPLEPINPYGQSKLMIERALEDYCRAYGLAAIALRYFNAAGADPESQLGEEHEPETHLIPLVLQVAAGRRDRIRINGADYDTPDGACIRDYIHVSDIAQAHVLALRRLENLEGFTAVNLGAGRGFSVREIIAAARRVTGRPIPEETGPRRDGDPAVLVADAGRAARLLGWRPRMSGLDDIIGTAWRWMMSRASVV